MRTSVNGATEAQNIVASNWDAKIRGVWHRPNSSKEEQTLDGVCRVLDDFKSSGINLVFLETLYHGMSIWKNDLVPYNYRYENCTYGDYPDYLTAFVTEADKRGIKVHAWVQDFYVGVKEEREIIKKHPEWMLINQAGELRHTTEGVGFGGYLFLDPANSEVRDFLISFYDKLLTAVPKIAGLNMDYIRYPISVFEEDTDTGYTPACMSDFAAKQGLSLDPENMREDLHSKIVSLGLVEEWIAHRSEYVTAFVRGVREMVDTKHPGKKVSTAIFPEIEQTYVKKKQSIKVWLDNRYVDMVTPMVHFYGAAQVYQSVKELKAMCGDISCYTGLYTTYHNQLISELSEHIDASGRAGAEGFVLFDSAKTFYEAAEDYKSFLADRFGKN